MFHEIYGSYYNVLAEILKEAVRTPVTDRQIREIIAEKGFGESGLSIPEALRTGRWPLLNRENRTPLRNEPEMPLTELEKSWLKAIRQDPRVKLFDPPEEEWPEIIPLFEPDFFVYYDRYGDGDPFEDPDYIRHFRTVRQGLITGRKLDIEFQGLSHLRRKILIPDRLEYSPKDDKFRLLGHTESPRNYIVNIGRIRNVELLGPVTEEDPAAPEPEKRELVMELRDERNALERAMLHFSDLEKETVRTGEDTYRIRLVYRRDDEPEILIRILSFGPMLKVVEPESFVRQIRERLNRQN